MKRFIATLQHDLHSPNRCMQCLAYQWGTYNQEAEDKDILSPYFISNKHSDGTDVLMYGYYLHEKFVPVGDRSVSAMSIIRAFLVDHLNIL